MSVTERTVDRAVAARMVEYALVDTPASQVHYVAKIRLVPEQYVEQVLNEAVVYELTRMTAAFTGKRVLAEVLDQCESFDDVVRYIEERSQTTTHTHARTHMTPGRLPTRAMSDRWYGGGLFGDLGELASMVSSTVKQLAVSTGQTFKTYLLPVLTSIPNEWQLIKMARVADSTKKSAMLGAWMRLSGRLILAGLHGACYPLAAMTGFLGLCSVMALFHTLGSIGIDKLQSKQLKPTSKFMIDVWKHALVVDKSRRKDGAVRNVQKDVVNKYIELSNNLTSYAKKAKETTGVKKLLELKTEQKMQEMMQSYMILTLLNLLRMYILENGNVDLLHVLKVIVGVRLTALEMVWKDSNKARQTGMAFTAGKVPDYDVQMTHLKSLREFLEQCSMLRAQHYTVMDIARQINQIGSVIKARLHDSVFKVSLKLSFNMSNVARMSDSNAHMSDSNASSLPSVTSTRKSTDSLLREPRPQRKTRFPWVNGTASTSPPVRKTRFSTASTSKQNGNEVEYFASTSSPSVSSTDSPLRQPPLLKTHFSWANGTASTSTQSVSSTELPPVRKTRLSTAATSTPNGNEIEYVTNNERGQKKERDTAAADKDMLLFGNFPMWVQTCDLLIEMFERFREDGLAKQRGTQKQTRKLW